MKLTVGVVMDPIGSIQVKKDSTLAMLWEAKTRGCELYYLEMNNLFLRDGIPYGEVRKLDVFHDEKRWFSLSDPAILPLAQLNIILMRKDPPFSTEYIYSTYILEHAERLGSLVVNRPQALRDANEKMFATYFPAYCPPTLVSSSLARLTEFWHEYKDIVCKPLDSMGGTSIFRLREQDVNANVIFHTLTHAGRMPIMLQTYIPEITAGDKRIILINGTPVPYALARVPQAGDWRGNLVVGAKGIVQPLSKRDYFICEQIGPILRDKGLYFVGIDVIGDYLTEVNVTSPTGIRELDKGAQLNIAGLLFDELTSI